PAPERLPDRETQHPPANHKEHHQSDNRHELIDDEVQIQPRGKRRHGGLHHVDAVRLSPGPSFPALPSRALASNRSVKSTRSASSATSRRSSSTAASTSSCPAAPPAWLSALRFAR